MKPQQNQQDAMLNAIRRDSAFVTIYLVNGLPLRGTVKGFDNFTILLESEGKQHMVYKHAVSTITPQTPINLLEEQAGGEEK